MTLSKALQLTPFKKMNNVYYTIKDNCRKGLLKYLSQALSIIPAIENPLLLDIGCGTGVPTLALAEKFNGHIIAIDINAESIQKIGTKSKRTESFK